MLKRFLYHEVIKHLKHKNALIITGMRQVGKTTLMKQIFNEIENPKLWFDFDNPLDLLHFENIDYDAIYETLKKEASAGRKRLFIFIDEIQNFPEITKIIKYHIDKYYLISKNYTEVEKTFFPMAI